MTDPAHFLLLHGGAGERVDLGVPAGRVGVVAAGSVAFHTDARGPLVVAGSAVSDPPARLATVITRR